jgi:hypothetical protein
VSRSERTLPSSSSDTNLTVRDPVEMVYSAGQIVYVNRFNPVPPAPSPDATDDEKLAYDKENLWVGLIAEFRAESPEKVYLRVFWLYWPEELPGGRQSYHGKKELVLSNHVDIVDAASIACHADVSHWDENDDSNATVLRERFWRQTYNLKKLLTDSHNVLSKLRKYCVCGGYDNPEHDMFQCHKVGCGMWSHEACLVNDIAERAWDKFKNGMLTHEVHEDNKSLIQKITSTAGHMVEKALHLNEIKDEAHSEIRSGKKAKIVSHAKKPWSGKLEAEIIQVPKQLGEITHRAVVRQLVATYNSKPSPSFEVKTWNMDMPCLRCRQSLN